MDQPRMTTSPDPWRIGSPPGCLLALGVATIALATNRWGVWLLGWIAPVPFLLAARRLAGWRRWLIFLGVTCLAGLLATAKIVTDPVPPVLALLFGIPAGISIWLVRNSPPRPGRDGGALRLRRDRHRLRLVRLRGGEPENLGEHASLPAGKPAAAPVGIAGGGGMVSFIMGWFAAGMAALLGSEERSRIHPPYSGGGCGHRRGPGVGLLAAGSAAGREYGNGRRGGNAGRERDANCRVTVGDNGGGR